jgi:hypothetical protein
MRIIAFIIAAPAVRVILAQLFGSRPSSADIGRTAQGR